MRISIIIPAKNEEKNIGLCLSALSRLEGDLHDFEVIVVDNGSTDRTRDVAAGFGHPVFIQPELTLSGLRNYGASAATSDILAFLDADCIVDPRWLANLQKNMLDQSVGCTGSTPIAPDDGSWVERVWGAFRTRRAESCYVSWINSSNFVVRKELFSRVGGFNENVKTCEDVDICLRLKKICNILFDPSVRVMHLGEPKTCWQFFKKEVWRGSGALRGVLSHGLVFSELKSLVLPIYYITLYLIAFVVLLVYGLHSTKLLALCLFCYVLPAIFFSVWAARATRNIQYFFGYLMLFLIYANARAYAIFQTTAFRRVK